LPKGSLGALSPLYAAIRAVGFAKQVGEKGLPGVGQYQIALVVEEGEAGRRESDAREGTEMVITPAPL
jgi:hypothetical protein